MIDPNTVTGYRTDISTSGWGSPPLDSGASLSNPNFPLMLKAVAACWQSVPLELYSEAACSRAYA